jgi:hypothetical protein
VVHVTSSRRLREDEAKDGRVDAIGCIRLLYPYFTIFVVLDHRGILVFYNGPTNRTLGGWGSLSLS